MLNISSFFLTTFKNRFATLSPFIIFIALLFFCGLSQANEQKIANEQSNIPAKQVPPEAAFAFALSAAEQGDSDALLTVGSFYEQGIGVQRNFTKAFEWYSKAAEAGKAIGYYNVGVCYEIGMGVTYNLEKAFQNYNKAASLLLPISFYKLAGLYLSGSGTETNEGKGLQFLNKASDAGVANASNELGIIYLNGLFKQKSDPKMAFDYFAKGAEAGNIDAIKNLAFQLKTGNGIKANPVKAYKWLSIAYHGGYTESDVTNALEELENTLSEKQIEQATKESEDWITKFNNKNQKPN